MKKQEAFNLLEITATSSKEEAKKAFRKLASKYHPDVNKDAGAEDKFKKINEAYRCVESDTFDDNQMPFPGGNYSSGFSGGMPNDIFNTFFNRNHQQTAVRREPIINVEVNISFKDSVLGCSTNLSYTRKSKCNPCNGKGSIGNCSSCKGSGFKSHRHGNSVFTMQCDDCQKSKLTECNDCKSKGFVESNTSVSVNIPPGITQENTLRLTEVGHYCGSTVFGEAHSDVHLKVNISDSNGMRISGHSVESDLTISLLEALKGIDKEVLTIDGMKTVSIPPLFKHRNTVQLPKLGLMRKGNHVVNVSVDYPENVDTLIAALEGK
jgi:molecular chaperone DnaJ